MSLKLNQSLLEENINLRIQRNSQAEQLQKLNDQISKLTTRIEELLSRPATVITAADKSLPDKVPLKDSTPMFIPTPSTDELSLNISDVKVKTRKTNIKDSVDKLSKLNESK